MWRPLSGVMAPQLLQPVVSPLRAALAREDVRRPLPAVMALELLQHPVSPGGASPAYLSAVAESLRVE